MFKHLICKFTFDEVYFVMRFTEARGLVHASQTKVDEVHTAMDRPNQK